MNQIATDFLTRSFAFSETVALLLRSETSTRPQQRVVRVEQVLEARYMAWLEHQNRLGSNVYVSVNPLMPGSRKRTKECIASVRHLYIDIDDHGQERLDAMRASEYVPTPTAIFSTSPGKYQALWRVAGFDFEGQEETLKSIATAFGGDPACTDRNRVLRLPGFRNQKYSPAHLVTAEYPSKSVYGPDDFQIPATDAFPVSALDDDTRESMARKHSHSEEDWAWISSELARGRDAAKLTHELALRRADKSNPLYYAQRTVDIASARIWLSDGIRMDDVITMLEVRRRFEIPDRICAARAREIALTAQRMVFRRKMA